MTKEEDIEERERERERKAEKIIEGFIIFLNEMKTLSCMEIKNKTNKIVYIGPTQGTFRQVAACCKNAVGQWVAPKSWKFIQ